MISRLKPEYARAFLSVAPSFDKHAREHIVYELGSTREKKPRPDVYTIAFNRTNRGRFGVSARGSLLGALWLVSTLASSTVVAPEPSLPAIKAEARAGTPFERSPAAQRRRCPADCPTNASSGEKGIIKLAISPWGQVLVDGKAHGASPPLSHIYLAPGRHRIEVRNATLKPHIEEVQVAANQKSIIRHRFGER